ncbi:sugar ABC transporter permease [Paenibacillus sp.]|uniref:carbohydrate ABC transporter permease n=1 Tax=Paenibacillus sp. TaxID=58172 RepID=UPI0028B22195|nr:sugar ABC transporter permease [Paenibacillus sp.]
MKRTVGKNSIVNILYLPAILLFMVFVIYPLCRGVFLSFTNWNGYSQTYKIVGVDNYTRLFLDPNVLRSLINTLVYGIGSTFLQSVLGLGLAIYLNQKIFGRTIVRTVIYLPVMIAPLIMGYIMYFFVRFDAGAINDVMLAIGMNPVDWLADGTRATIIITLINSLQYVGVSMVIYLAGLQNIPDMYYEAAKVDGVNAWGIFRFITLPLLLPAISSAVVINLIGGLKLFDIIMALTSGGPGYDTHSLSTLVHRTYFGSENAGYASAIGLVTFLLILVIGRVVQSQLDKGEID